MKGKELKKLISDDAEIIIDDHGASLSLSKVIDRGGTQVLIPGVVFRVIDKTNSRD